MKKYIINFLKLAVSLGVGVSLVMWFMGQMSPEEKKNVIDDIKRANYLWVIVPPIIALLSNYFRTERWRILLRPLGYNPGLLNTFLSVMTMYFLNLFFPRLGEVTRCGILARYENVPLDKAIGTMVLERLLDVLCLGIVFLILVVAEHDIFFMLYHKIVSNSKETFGNIIARYQISPDVQHAVLGVVILAIILFIAYQIRKKGTETIVANLKERIMGLVKGIISIKDVKNPFALVFHTVMLWVCYFLMPYLGFRMFPETAHLSLLAGGVCLFFGGVAFSLTPGGLGLAPIFSAMVVTAYLGKDLLPGASISASATSAAISYGWVQWSVQTVAVLIVGVISLILLAIINREPALEDVTLKT